MSANPAHVAIIMDGNGRWAEARGLPRVEGHRRGVEALRQTVEASIEFAIPYLTVFSFSSENWSRPESEISDLMGLLKRFIRRDLAELHRAGVKIRIIGERTGVGADIVMLLDEAEALTRDNTKLNLQIAFNYGGRSEIVEAARRIAAEVRDGRLDVDQIDARTFADHLFTAGVPDPDLLIRTSGELRLSNFLLWQVAYAELVFLDIYWPDFNKERLAEAIAIFNARQRRFGGRASQSAS